MADVIAYNGSDKWKQKATELLNQGGGGGGLVDDVKVNGTSVVDANKVANIDLTPYAESADLATVATSGDYDDLSNKPTIPAAQVQSDWLEADSSAVDYIKNKPNLATVATSGSYDDLSNKPTIPAAQVQSDWNEADTSAKSYILNKPTIPSAQVNSDWNASSGVAQILNKPTIPPTLSASGNIEIDSKVIKRKEVWLNSVAEYEALANPDSNTDYHVPSVTFGLLPITVVNGKICCHYTKEV